MARAAPPGSKYLEVYQLFMMTLSVVIIIWLSGYHHLKTQPVVIIIRASSQKQRGSQSEKILASLTHDKVHQPPSVFYIQILKSQFFVNICRIFYPQQQQKLLLFLVKCLRRQLCNYVCCKNYRKYLLSKLLQHLFSVIQILPYI